MSQKASVYSTGQIMKSAKNTVRLVEWRPFNFGRRQWYWKAEVLAGPRGNIDANFKYLTESVLNRYYKPEGGDK